jgi:hypothetical protein
MAKWYEVTGSRSVVREYASRGAMDREIQEASAFGWRVASVSELSQRPGCLRGCTLGLFALVWRPRSHVMVTFNHD